MELFVARQPILDSKLRTVGYELLFRNGFENSFNDFGGNQATSRVINISFFNSAISQITSGKKAYINFTRFLLLEDIWKLLPADKVVIEILEDIEPDDQVIQACKRLKQEGYIIALDDYTSHSGLKPLFPYTDIIKMDLLQSDPDEMKCKEILEEKSSIKFLAEKVEQHKVFDMAKNMGYSFFQGYFFDKPQLIQLKSANESRLSTVRLLKTVCSKDLDFSEAEIIFKHDPVLTIKLLRYINSAAIGLRYQISSIRQALSIIGQNNLKKWVLILIMSKGVEKKADELIRQTIYRARFCELLAEEAGMNRAGQELFMTGLFSLMDAIFDDTLDSLLEKVSLSNEIVKALRGEQTPYYFILELVRAFEKGRWQDVFSFSGKIKINEIKLPVLHKHSIDFVDSLAGLI